MNELTNALKCLAVHAGATQPDAKGHIFVYRGCGNCDQDVFCNKVMSLMETELNDRALLVRFLEKR